MAVSIAYGISALAAVGSYTAQQKSASIAKQNADTAAVQAQAQTTANNEAAQNAAAKNQTASAVQANEALAAAQTTVAPQVTISDGTDPNQQRRVVQAQFDLGSGGAGSTGSIRV